MTMDCGEDEKDSWLLLLLGSETNNRSSAGKNNKLIVHLTAMPWIKMKCIWSDAAPVSHGCDDVICKYNPQLVNVFNTESNDDEMCKGVLAVISPQRIINQLCSSMEYYSPVHCFGFTAHLLSGLVSVRSSKLLFSANKLINPLCSTCSATYGSN